MKTTHQNPREVTSAIIVSRMKDENGKVFLSSETKPAQA